MISEVSYLFDLGECFQVDKMMFKDIWVDLVVYCIDIVEVSNKGSCVWMLCNKEGKIEWVSLLVFKIIWVIDVKVRDEKLWIGNVVKLIIDDLVFCFEDQVIKLVVIQELDGFSLQGENFGNVLDKKGWIGLQGKVNKIGKVIVGGGVQLMLFDLVLKVEIVFILFLLLQFYFIE